MKWTCVYSISSLQLGVWFKNVSVVVSQQSKTTLIWTSRDWEKCPNYLKVKSFEWLQKKFPKLFHSGENLVRRKIDSGCLLLSEICIVMMIFHNSVMLYFSATSNLSIIAQFFNGCASKIVTRLNVTQNSHQCLGGTTCWSWVSGRSSLFMIRPLNGTVDMVLAWHDRILCLSLH